MNAAAMEIFSSWTPPAGLTIAALCASAVYLAGWRRIRVTRPGYFTQTKLWCFLSGVAVLWLAVASPLDGFADTLLSAHMVQHFLLMSIAPPLLLLGAPAVPLLRGLPRWLVKGALGPLIAQRWLHHLGVFFLRPAVAWLAFNLVFLLWHVPKAYDFALRHENVHDMEHLCFLSTALLFWQVVLHPWPDRSARDHWLVLPYLLSADIVNTALSAFLAFCNRPLYAFYAAGPNPFHIAPLSDQAAAGAIMWVLNSFVFVAPAMLITVRLLNESGRRRATGPAV